MEEYRAAVSSWISLHNCRFTLIGLYLAAVGLLFNSCNPRAGIVILCLAPPIWLIEFRTRRLLRRIHEWLKDAERKNKDSGLEHPSDNSPRSLFYDLDYAKVQFRVLGFLVPHFAWSEGIISYSTAIDFLMLVSIGAAIAKLLWF